MRTNAGCRSSSCRPSAARGDIVQGLEIGADDYLAKPCCPRCSPALQALRRLLDMQRRPSGLLEQVRAVANGVIDGIISATRTGTILSRNRLACRIFGYTAAEMGRPEPADADARAGTGTAHDGYRPATPMAARST